MRHSFPTTIPRSFFLKMREGMVSLGMDTDDSNRRQEENMRGWPDEEVNVTLDVTASVGEKRDAHNCRRTQLGPGNLFRRLPEETTRSLLSHEHFALAWPQPEPGQHLAGLFDGLLARTSEAGQTWEIFRGLE